MRAELRVRRPVGTKVVVFQCKAAATGCDSFDREPHPSWVAPPPKVMLENGVVGACVCGSKCATASCPCKKDKKACTAMCHPRSRACGNTEAAVVAAAAGKAKQSNKRQRPVPVAEDLADTDEAKTPD